MLGKQDPPESRALFQQVESLGHVLTVFELQLGDGIDEGGEGAEPEQLIFIAAQKDKGEYGRTSTGGKGREAVRG